MRSGSAQRHAAPKHSWDGITKGTEGLGPFRGSGFRGHCWDDISKGTRHTPIRSQLEMLFVGRVTFSARLHLGDYPERPTDSRGGSVEVGSICRDQQ